MIWLIVVVLAVLVVALYPVVRDWVRRRQAAAPSYVEGLQLALDHRTDQAIARLKDAVEQDTDNVDAYIRLGDLLMERGDVDRALRIHENLALRRNLDPRDERRVYQALVRDYLRTDRKVKAISLLEELIHQDKTDFSSREQLLRLYIDTGSWDKGEELLKELDRSPADRPGAARLLTEFGRELATKDPTAARSYFDRALHLDPKSVLARVYLGDHLLTQGDTDEAIKVWNEVLNSAPEQNVLVRERLERAYYEAGRYDDVIQLYEKLLRRIPDDGGLAVDLAEILRKKEDLPGAIQLLERVARKESADARIQVALARLYIESGQPARAASLLESVLDRLHSSHQP